uniref:Uncharacterized protein n=1 Tax=Arion vulgaris TaxID=1028688 RepID=A0A0B6Z7S7_9EUPU
MPSKPFYREELKGNEQKEDQDTSGRETSRDGHIAAWHSATQRQDPGSVGSLLQPVFDAETTNDDVRPLMLGTSIEVIQLYQNQLLQERSTGNIHRSYPFIPNLKYLYASKWDLLNYIHFFTVRTKCNPPILSCYNL